MTRLIEWIHVHQLKFFLGTLTLVALLTSCGL